MKQNQSSAEFGTTAGREDIEKSAYESEIVRSNAWRMVCVKQFKRRVKDPNVLCSFPMMCWQTLRRSSRLMYNRHSEEVEGEFSMATRFSGCGSSRRSSRRAGGRLRNWVQCWSCEGDSTRRWRPAGRRGACPCRALVCCACRLLGVTSAAVGTVRSSVALNACRLCTLRQVKTISGDKGTAACTVGKSDPKALIRQMDLRSIRA